MDTQFWHHFAIGFLVVNTLCVVILLEMIIVGKPFVSGFLVLFALMYWLNRRLLFRRK